MTVNRGIHSPIYTDHLLFFSPCGTMFPHGLTCAGRVATYWTPDAIRTATITWTRVHAIVKFNTCANTNLSDDDRRDHRSPRGDRRRAYLHQHPDRAIAI